MTARLAIQGLALLLGLDKTFCNLPSDDLRARRRHEQCAVRGKAQRCMSLGCELQDRCRCCGRQIGCAPALDRVIAAGGPDHAAARPSPRDDLCDPSLVRILKHALDPGARYAHEHNAAIGTSQRQQHVRGRVDPRDREQFLVAPSVPLPQ